MNTPIIPIIIKECKGEVPPNRKLVISFNYTNPAEYNILILDAWIDIRIQNGQSIAEGRLFKQLHNRRVPAVIPPNKNGLGEFHVDLPAHVLHEIEKVRAGGDLQLNINSRILVANIDDSISLTKPFESAFSIDGNEQFKYEIPQSEWVKILKSIQWSELELIELPISRIRAIPELSRALSRFENAQNCYRRGDWDETMVNCRKAFEALIKDLSGKDDMGNSLQVISSLIGDDTKAKIINDIVNELGNFLHLGRHEQQPNITIKRPDSEFALILTGALLNYFGKE